MRIDESNYLVIDRAERLLFTEYEKRWFDAENIDGYIDNDTLIDIISDLCDEIELINEELEEEKNKYEEDIRENYKPISPYEFYGVSEHDFD